jgi:hypothetical protein
MQDQKQKQIHKRLTTDQVKMILQDYCHQTISRDEALELLGIKRSRFSKILKSYRQAPETFKLDYQRQSPLRLDESWEKAIIKELSLEQELIANPNNAITKYNYSAIRERLEDKEIKVSRPTIVNRAKNAGFYLLKPKKKVIHDRCVVTPAVGALIQHDASIHLWSPYAKEKWILIVSIDDYSRVILYADFVSKETTWAHINAAKELMTKYGIPLRYYVDQLRVFEYISHQNSVWQNQRAKTDEVLTQWKLVMKLLKVQVTHALSPQAKGKVERPFSWLQDRITRACAKEQISQIEAAREILQLELDRYHNRRVHSTTKEIPMVRFQKATGEGKNFFRPLEIPQPYQSLDDIFCIRETRRTDGYRRISLFNQKVEVPKTPPREEVNIHMVPKIIDKQNIVEFRIWWKEQLVYHNTYPMTMFSKVHF